MRHLKINRKYSPAFLIVFIAIVIFTNPASSEDKLFAQDIEALKGDYKQFYGSGENLLKLGAGIGVAGVFANTSVDADLQKYYRSKLKGDITDGTSKVFRLPGEVFLTIPLLAGTRLLLRDTTTGDWSQKSLRAIIVGAPAGLFIQRATGASRPLENDSKWRPFKDGNGLSGHAFIGAVPFITAAKMNDNPYIKSAFYVLSAMPGLSRVNDDKHYLSQAALGWYLAFLSCNAVEKTDSKNKTVFLITPLSNRASGILIRHSF